MAELPNDPKGAYLEEWVSAHFASRGCYVETTIKELKPDEILELDVVWTDYRKDPEERHPVEVKSGKWSLPDVFKFYGWTRYLDLEPGQFVHTQPCDHDPASLSHVQQKTGISLIHIAAAQKAEEYFGSLGLPEPPSPQVTQLWRFSFWARRRLVKSLGVAIDDDVCAGSGKAAKKYLRLVNDAVFFIPDVRDRIEILLKAHFDHQMLGKSAAYEIESKKVEYVNPPDTKTFRKAWFDGAHFPVQACMYVEHRARLYIMKALVDYWLARQRGRLAERKKNVVLLGGKAVGGQQVGITNAMEAALAKLSVAKSFRLFPVLWQALLWNWGGFLRRDHLDEEYALLAGETGVPVNDIPLALTAFDEIFPIYRGWFRDVDERRVLILMPAVLRGIGAHRRRIMRGVEHFKDLDCGEVARASLVAENNALANLLDCLDQELAK